MNDPKFEQYKKKILDFLEKQDDEEKTISKAFSLAEMEVMQKSKGYDVGTVREWKGKKFKKVAPNKWVKVYDKQSRGAMMAIAALRRKADQCKDSKELMQLILENRERFSDDQGRPLPFVKDFSDYVSGLNDKFESGNNEEEKDNTQSNNKGADAGKVDKKDDKKDEKNYDAMSDDELRTEIEREKSRRTLEGDMKASELQKKLKDRQKQNPDEDKKSKRDELLDAYNKAKDPDERDRIYNELQKLDGKEVKDNSNQQSDADFIQSVVGKDEYKSDEWDNEDDKDFADSLGLSKEQFDDLMNEYNSIGYFMGKSDPKIYMKSAARYTLEALNTSGYRTDEFIKEINKKEKDAQFVSKVMEYAKGIKINPGDSVENIENKLKGVMTAKAWGWYEDYKETRRKLEEEWKQKQEKVKQEKETAEKRYKGNRTPENDVLAKTVEDSPIYKAKTIEDALAECKKFGVYVYDSSMEALKKLNQDAVKKSLVGICKIREDFPFIKEPIGGGGVKVGKMKNTKAWYEPSDNTINFDKIAYMNDYKAKTDLMIPDSDAASVGVHETTHALMHYLNTIFYGIGVDATIKWNKGVLPKEIVSKAIKEIKKTEYGKGLKKEQLQKAISGYAASHEHETVAEAMADYYKYGENANPLSIAIYKNIKETYDNAVKQLKD